MVWTQPLISESSEKSQTDSEVVNPKRKKKPPLINETTKLESDSEVKNPKRKTKPLLINESQEDDRFVIDEEYDLVVEKWNIGYLSMKHFLSFSFEKIQSESRKIKIYSYFEISK